MDIGLVFLLLVVAAALVVLLFYRKRQGFGAGEVVAHDSMTLRSERYRVSGRPDRITRRGDSLIVEDKKPGARLFDSHRVQMGIYLILAEEHFGVQPSHAVVVLNGGKREVVENTEQLREWALDVVEQIRQARRQLSISIPVVAVPAKCRRCGQRDNCEQRAD